MLKKSGYIIYIIYIPFISKKPSRGVRQKIYLRPTMGFCSLGKVRYFAEGSIFTLESFFYSALYGMLHGKFQIFAKMMGNKN